jgi:hypothetical protein
VFDLVVITQHKIQNDLDGQEEVSYYLLEKLLDEERESLEKNKFYFIFNM